VWDRIAEAFPDHAEKDNRNDRFTAAGKLNQTIGAPEEPGPFWGCPKGRRSLGLLPTKPRFSPSREIPHDALPEWRIVEERLKKSGFSSIQSVWKLFTQGSVGSQALLGIPVVRALRYASGLAEVSRVWPFETEFATTLAAATRPSILHTEIWPGVLEATNKRLPATGFACRDEAQVFALANVTRELDELDRLGDLVERPDGLTASEARICTQEEGWILGAGIAPSLATEIAERAARLIEDATKLSREIRSSGQTRLPRFWLRRRS